MSLDLDKETIQKYLDTIDIKPRLKIVVLPSGAHTSAQAASAIGCKIDQIAKSLVFVGKESGKAYLVIASGTNRVNLAQLSEVVGEGVKMADPEFVLGRAGYAVGGVPPVGHPEKIDTYIDEDLMQYKEVWSAGGHPSTVFPLTPKILQQITQGKVVGVK